MWKRLVVLAAVVIACAEAHAGVARVSVEFWQDADSARYVVRWVPGDVTPPRQAPLAHYLTRIVVTPPGDTVASGLIFAPANRDTVALAYPAVGDSIGPLVALVTAIDTLGQQSVDSLGVETWARSASWWLHTRSLPPSLPDSVTVDSTLVVGAVESVHVRPLFATIAPGDTVRFCAIYQLEDGRSGLADNSKPFPECQAAYLRWLDERSA